MQGTDQHGALLLAAGSSRCLQSRQCGHRARVVIEVHPPSPLLVVLNALGANCKARASLHPIALDHSIGILCLMSKALLPLIPFLGGSVPHSDLKPPRRQPGRCPSGHLGSVS